LTVDLLDCRVLILEAIPLEAVPREIQILPRGRPPDYLVKSAKGSFIVDDEAVRLILANFTAQQNDLVIDYEHQTYSGGEAPAAGWIKNLEDRGEAGIWATVEWTERALGYLQRKEYRYLSPVVYVRKSDNRAVYIESAALTNLPAIDGMVPIVNKIRAEETPMEAKRMSKLLEKLRNRLKLSATATEEEIERALDALPPETPKEPMETPAAKTVIPQSTLDLLGLAAGASEAEVNARIMALAAAAQAAEANLATERQVREEDELVRAALSAGKITPAMEEWARRQIRADREAFKLFLRLAPQVVPLERLKTAEPGRSPASPNDDIQRFVNKQLGIDDAAFAKYGGGEKEAE